MKVIFNSALFNDFIKKSKSIKSKGIQIRCTNEDIHLINCDLVNQVSTTISGEIYEEGTVVIPSVIFPLIKNNEFMTITNEGVEIGSRIVSVDLKDEYYVNFEDDFKYNVFDLSDKEIKYLLEVEHAVSKDLTKPVLNGIRIEKNKFIGIDGFRMCERVGNFKSDIPITISNYKLLKSLKGQAKATCSDKYIKYQVDNYNYCDRLIQGDFIQVDKLKPREFNTRITVNKDEILDILSSVENLSSKVKNQLVKFNIRENVINIQAANDKKEDDKVKVDIKFKDSINCVTEGDNIDIAFNCKYMIDAIKNMDKEVTMSFTTNVNPVIIESPGKYELILPVRIATQI